MTTHYTSPRVMLVQGNSLDLSFLPDDTVDSIVTDPPYELGFMGKSWDSAGVAYNPALWREALRVLKPGGHLLAFGGTRTYHRMTCAIEDAGFEVRDSLHWMYGTGFPKSMNAGEGRGTALKPAHEPIVLARKPLIGTVAKNLEAFGTGALNIDVCRIALAEDENPEKLAARSGRSAGFAGGLYAGGTLENPKQGWDCSKGRWPANVLLDEDAAAELDEQSGILKSGSNCVRRQEGYFGAGDARHGGLGKAGDVQTTYGDSGGASRFFYVAKPARKERDLGGIDNKHPTVKPVELMRYLVRLVTPPGGLVLDLFLGSGTTGMAAMYEGRNFVGVELTEEYLPIATARIRHVENETGERKAA